MWRQREWVRLSRSSGIGSLRIDMCRFGCLWRKRTRFVTTIESIRTSTLLCQHNHPREFFYRGRWSEHLVLRGFAPWGQARTHMAEAYPLSLADLLAAACLDSAESHGQKQSLRPEKFAEAGLNRSEAQREKHPEQELGAPMRPANKSR